MSTGVWLWRARSKASLGTTIRIASRTFFPSRRRTSHCRCLPQASSWTPVSPRKAHLRLRRSPHPSRACRPLRMPPPPSGFRLILSSLPTLHSPSSQCHRHRPPPPAYSTPLLPEAVATTRVAAGRSGSLKAHMLSRGTTRTRQSRPRPLPSRKPMSSAPLLSLTRRHSRDQRIRYLQHLSTSLLCDHATTIQHLMWTGDRQRLNLRSNCLDPLWRNTDPLRCYPLNPCRHYLDPWFS